MILGVDASGRALARAAVVELGELGVDLTAPIGDSRYAAVRSAALLGPGHVAPLVPTAHFEPAGVPPTDHARDTTPSTLLGLQSRPVTTYSTFPEASYAVTLTKVGPWPRQRDVVELICAYAAAHRIIEGEIHLSERGLAGRMHGSESSSTPASNLLDKLVDRHVLRLLHAGEGTAPSIWRIWHWTRWEVPWKIRPGSVQERLTAFAAAEISAQPGSSAPLMMGALTTSARAISARISDLARSPLEGARKASTSATLSQVNGSRGARYAPGLSSSWEGDESPSMREEEFDQRATDLIAAVQFITGLKRVYGRPAARLARVAAEANGRLDELVALTRNYAGRPLLLDEHVTRLERLLVAPAVDNFDRRRAGSASLRSVEEIRAELEGAPITADVGRQALAELKTQVRSTKRSSAGDTMEPCSESE